MSRARSTPALSPAESEAKFSGMARDMGLRHLGATREHPAGDPARLRALAATHERCEFVQAAGRRGMFWKRDPDPVTGEDRATKAEAEGVLGRTIDPGDPAEWEAAARELTALLGGLDK